MRWEFAANSGIPIYLQIREMLLKAIKAGQFLPENRLPTERELAEQLQVSRMTVRKAITTLVDDEILVRYPSKGTFVSSVSVVSGVMEENRSNTSTDIDMIGLIIPYVNDYYASGLIEGVENVTRQKGCGLLLRSSQELAEREARDVQELISLGARGLIIFPSHQADSTCVLRKLEKDGFPFVLVDRYFDVPKVYSVTSDNFGGAYEAVKHLIIHGRVRIAFYSRMPSTLSSIMARLSGYYTALEAYGISLEPDLVMISKEPDFRFGKDCIGDIVQFLVDAKPDAVFAANDYFAWDVVRAAKRTGLKVPSDLAVVGFDDMDSSGCLPIPLTTVAQAKVDMGMVATRLLFRQMEGQTGVRETVVLPTRLVVRESCGGKARDNSALCGRGVCANLV